MGEFICDSGMAWEVTWFHLTWGEILLHPFISALAHHHAGAAAGRLEKGEEKKNNNHQKINNKKRNGHLVALTNCCYSKHWKPDPAATEPQRSFPTGFTGGKAFGPGAACDRQTDRQSQPCQCNVLPAAILPEQPWIMRVPSPAARQWLFKRLFEKDKQQHLKRSGQNSLPAQCFLSNGKCSA